MFVWSNGQLTAPPYKARFQFSPGMMTSSNGNIFRVTGPLCGEFTGPGEFPTQRPVTQSFGVFFELRLNKRLSKQSWGWWSETPSRSLWRHCNGKYVRCSRFDVVFCCSGSYRIISLERLAQYQRNKPKKNLSWILQTNEINQRIWVMELNGANPTLILVTQSTHNKANTN